MALVDVADIDDGAKGLVEWFCLRRDPAGEARVLAGLGRLEFHGDGVVLIRLRSDLNAYKETRTHYTQKVGSIDIRDLYSKSGSYFRTGSQSFLASFGLKY